MATWNQFVNYIKKKLNVEGDIIFVCPSIDGKNLSKPVNDLTNQICIFFI